MRDRDQPLGDLNIRLSTEANDRCFLTQLHDHPPLKGLQKLVCLDCVHCRHLIVGLSAFACDATDGTSQQ